MRDLILLIWQIPGTFKEPKLPNSYPHSIRSRLKSLPLLRISRTSWKKIRPSKRRKWSTKLVAHHTSASSLKDPELPKITSLFLLLLTLYRLLFQNIRTTTTMTGAAETTQKLSKSLSILPCWLRKWA